MNKCKDHLNIGTLNCRGLTKTDKKLDLTNDLDSYKVDITALQETKIKGDCWIEYLKSKSGINYTFYKSNCSNSYHGVGFIVNNNINCSFRSLSNRLCLLTVYRKYNNKTHPLYIINAYAPTSEITSKNVIETEQFYNDLETLINCVNKNELIICGDFNAKTGSSHHTYPRNIGLYTTDKTNANGEFLINLIVKNNFYICNTFFKHKLEHINTWTSNFTPNGRRNPLRSQIDYIIAPDSFRRLNTNARACNGLTINSDHKLVISTFILNGGSRSKIYPNTTKPKNSPLFPIN